ncbi:MAG: cyanophycin synthetase [Candidatus Limnocylindrales bacterium]
MTRSAGDIGAGLLPIRDARPIPPGERIHVIGIAGAGASAAALLAAAQGARVSGCDSGGPSPYSEAVEAAGIEVTWVHDPAHLTGGGSGPVPARLAVTKALTAIAPGHPELVAATSAGIPIESWQQVVADAAAGRQLVAVAGTHGKSTTSGWLTHVLVQAELDPSAFVGALLPTAISGGVPATARVGTGPQFVVEADEYAGNFDAYRPDLAVLTSLEWDHPDVFADVGAVADAFERWIRNMPRGGTLVANAGDPGVATLLDRISESLPLRIISVALADGPADPGFRAGLTPGRYASGLGPATLLVGRITATTPSATTIEISGVEPDSVPASVAIPTAGRHNAANAMGVVGAALGLGIEPGVVMRGLATFPGIGRRLERKGEAGGVVVYDDYGHHPTAIAATIAAMRQREPERRLWAVYEPLTFHRTAALLDEFATSLAAADAVVVADIWAGRDPDTTIASAEGLAEAVRGVDAGLKVAAPGSVDAAAEWLAREVQPNDAVLVMGGGRSYRIAERLLELLRATCDEGGT